MTGREDRGRPPKRERRLGQEAAHLGNNGTSTSNTRSTGHAQYLAEMRFRRDVGRVHRLGPRVMFELLAELGRKHFIRSEVEQLAARYAARLDPALLRAVGADRFPPLPLRAVAGDRR